MCWPSKCRGRLSAAAVHSAQAKRKQEDEAQKAKQEERAVCASTHV